MVSQTRCVKLNNLPSHPTPPSHITWILMSVPPEVLFPAGDWTRALLRFHPTFIILLSHDSTIPSQPQDFAFAFAEFFPLVHSSSLTRCPWMAAQPWSILADPCPQLGVVYKFDESKLHRLFQVISNNVQVDRSHNRPLHSTSAATRWIMPH